MRPYIHLEIKYCSWAIPTYASLTLVHRPKLIFFFCFICVCQTKKPFHVTSISFETIWPWLRSCKNIYTMAFFRRNSAKLHLKNPLVKSLCKNMMEKWEILRKQLHSIYLWDTSILSCPPTCSLISSNFANICTSLVYIHMTI